MLKRNNRGKIIAVLIAVFAVLCISVVFIFVNSDAIFARFGLRSKFLPQNGIMYVNFIDVGQGNCALITCGETSILVDSGEEPYAQTVTNYIKNQNIRKLDAVIATHPHSDHIGSLYKVLNEIDADKIYLPEIPQEFETDESFYTNLMEKSDIISFVKGGFSFTQGELKIEFFAPLGSYDDLNNYSLVTKISFKNNSVLIAADAKEDVENDILKSTADLRADILGVGHHGSGSSSSDEWLNAVNPEFAVISCGENNDYGHPNTELIKRLEAHNICSSRTDLSGNILFRCDGNKVEEIN